jgi:S-adenosylmethionine decarboxylase
MSRYDNYGIISYSFVGILTSNFALIKHRRTPMIVGTEWLIEAIDCDPSALRDESTIRSILEQVVADLELKPVGSVWHKFENEGGVTGLIALTESHLACHTYPEHGTATFNLYCCRTRPEWDWKNGLRTALKAGRVKVTKIERGDSEPAYQGLRSGSAGGGR